MEHTEEANCAKRAASKKFSTAQHGVRVATYAEVVRKQVQVDSVESVKDDDVEVSDEEKKKEKEDSHEVTIVVEDKNDDDDDDEAGAGSNPGEGRDNTGNGVEEAQAAPQENSGGSGGKPAEGSQEVESTGGFESCMSDSDTEVSGTNKKGRDSASQNHSVKRAPDPKERQLQSLLSSRKKARDHKREEEMEKLRMAKETATTVILANGSELQTASEEEAMALRRKIEARDLNREKRKNE